MEKLTVSNILVANAELTAIRLDDQNSKISKVIDDTRQMQSDVLKLKEVDQDRLRIVVQL